MNPALYRGLTGDDHWRKWPGRTACGIEAPKVDKPAEGKVTCLRCMSLLASTYAGMKYFVTAKIPLEEAMIDPQGYSTFEQAEEVYRGARRHMLMWIKKYGFNPAFEIVPDWTSVGPAAIRRWENERARVYE